MNTYGSLLSRYFDGRLDESEVEAFLDAVEQDEALAEELRRTERLLATAAAMDDVHAPASFVDAVMTRIEAEEDPATTNAESSSPRRAVTRSPRPSRRRVVQWASAVAVLALAFYGGMRVDGSTPDVEPSEAVIVQATQDLHAVRLVYVPPRDAAPEAVHVAGDFNGWNDAGTPLRRVGDVWTTTLRLPPGEYEYQFVENGERWVTDPLALRQRTDGFGGTNAVLDVGV